MNARSPLASDRDGVLDSMGAGPCVRLPTRTDYEAIASELAGLAPSTWHQAGRNPVVQYGVDAIFVVGSRRGPGARFQGERPVLGSLPKLRALVYEAVPATPVRAVLARLRAGEFVPLHADAHRYYLDTLRLAMPITTNERVRLYCDGLWYHCPVGETWAFNNLKRHAAINDGSESRIHLLVDYQPTPDLRELVTSGTPVEGRVDDAALTTLTARSRRRYAARRFHHLGYRALEFLHLR